MKQLLLICAVSFLAVLFISINPARAAFYCTTRVNRVILYGSGNVTILTPLRQNWMQVCNLKNEWKNINTTTCAMWAGLLLTAQREADNVKFYYGGTGDCSSIPTYGSATPPTYIGLE